MKRLIWILPALLLFSCKKDESPDSIRLLRTESEDNYSNVFHTQYEYDNKGRITKIREYKNNEQPVVAVSISYNGNEAVLMSTPTWDPAYTMNTEVRLTLDAAGKLLKRIEYTYRVVKNVPINPSQTFIYDTLVCEYDAAGLLKKTTGGRRDSLWLDPTYTIIRRYTSTATYTNNGGNITASDEYVTYPYIANQGGVITVSGGSSEYHNVFNYTKSFPNQTDFKNAAVLNEYKLYYEPFINKSYKNMPDKVIIHNIDRDTNGTVIFTGNGTVEMNRTYNGKGFLSSVEVLTSNTPYKRINYFY